MLIGDLLCLQTVANLGTISAVNIKGAGSGDSWSAMTNTYGAAWEVTNQPAYPISLEVTSGSQTVSSLPLPCITALSTDSCCLQGVQRSSNMLLYDISMAHKARAVIHVSCVHGLLSFLLCKKRTPTLESQL